MLEGAQRRLKHDQWHVSGRTPGQRRRQIFQGVEQRTVVRPETLAIGLHADKYDVSVGNIGAVVCGTQETFSNSLAHNCIEPWLDTTDDTLTAIDGVDLPTGRGRLPLHDDHFRRRIVLPSRSSAFANNAAIGMPTIPGPM